MCRKSLWGTRDIIFTIEACMYMHTHTMYTCTYICIKLKFHAKKLSKTYYEEKAKIVSYMTHPLWTFETRYCSMYKMPYHSTP